MCVSIRYAKLPNLLASDSEVERESQDFCEEWYEGIAEFPECRW
jgi:hypothetical protein